MEVVFALAGLVVLLALAGLVLAGLAALLVDIVMFYDVDYLERVADDRDG